MGSARNQGHACGVTVMPAGELPYFFMSAISEESIVR